MGGPRWVGAPHPFVSGGEVGGVGMGEGLFGWKTLSSNCVNQIRNTTLTGHLLKKIEYYLVYVY